MPKATGSADVCRKTYLSLEKEVERLLDEFLSSANKGESLFRVIEKVESQLSQGVKRMKGADLELNEIAVIADKLEGEIGDAEGAAAGAALLECEADWAVQFEAARKSLDRMAMQLRRMKSAMNDGSGMDARSVLLSFSRDAAACRLRIGKLRVIFESKNRESYRRVESAKKHVRILRAGIGKAFDRLAKGRLKEKIASAKSDISAHFRKSAKGRIFVDPKHLTLTTDLQRVRIPLTQTVRFALEEIAPIEKSLSKLGKGAHLVGSFEKEGNGTRITIGERTVAGDTIIYREKTYWLAG